MSDVVGILKIFRIVITSFYGGLKLVSLSSCSYSQNFVLMSSNIWVMPSAHASGPGILPPSAAVFCF